jgi:DNA modification methylase
MLLKPNAFFSDDIFISPLDQDCLTENLVLTSNIEVFSLPIESLTPHPIARLTYQAKSLFSLKLSLSLVGQLKTITVKMNKNGQYQIIDGLSRFFAAQELNMKTLKCNIVDVDDSDVPLLRSQINIHLPKSWTEKLRMVDEFLKRIGSSQGKKRDLKDILEICEVGNIPNELKDRYDIVRTVFDINISNSSLRKLMKAYEFEKDGNDEIKGLGLMEKIDNNTLTIDSADKLRENFLKTKIIQQELNSLEEIENYHGEVSFKLFNKSCEDILDVIQEDSVNMVICSPPYFQQRHYPEGINKISGPQLGEEKTREEYIQNLIRIFEPLKKVLKKDGNLFVNIAESYGNGYCLNVTAHLRVEMEKNGWFTIQPIHWNKSNPKPVGSKIRRLRPSQESILHFSLDPGKRFYRDFKIYDRKSDITLSNGCNDEIKDGKIQKKKKFSLKTKVQVFTDFLDSQKIEGIISGATVNKSRLKQIDPNFNHIAPAPDYLSIIPTLTTTKPGDTILDIFAGTSNLLVLPYQLGRNVIGLDTDPKSIDFSQKHLDHIGEIMLTNEEIINFENDYLNVA